MPTPFPDKEFIVRFAPVLLLDRLEPFAPIRVGVTVFEASGPSRSFPRTVRVDASRVRMVVEYAIYWDYDIQHLYDLEHVWIHVGHDGGIVGCEASFHGQYLIGLMRDGSNLAEDGRVNLYVQPGKHAMAPLAELFRLLPNVESCCLEEAGIDGVLEPDMFRGRYKSGDDQDRLAEAHLREFGFTPSFDYVPHEWAPDAFVSWEELEAEIPARMKSLLASLS